MTQLLLAGAGVKPVRRLTFKKEARTPEKSSLGIGIDFQGYRPAGFGRWCESIAKAVLPDLFQNIGGGEVHFPPQTQAPVDQGVDRADIVSPPGFGLEPEQLEFERQAIAVFFKIGIDAGGKGVGQKACLVREAPVLAGRGEGSKVAIGIQGLFSKDFRQAAAADPAVEFHLPQAVLGHGIAHGEKKIRFALCVNMRYAVDVAKDFHRVPDARHRDGTGYLRLAQ